MESTPQRLAPHAAVFAALAHPTRLEIVQLLCDGDRTPAQLAETIRVRRPNLSQHLSTLQREGLVRRRREASHVIYGVTDPRLAEACALIDQIISRELAGRAHALETEVQIA